MLTFGIVALHVGMAPSWAREGDHRRHGEGAEDFIKVEGILDLSATGADSLVLPTDTPVTVGLTFGLPSASTW
jgi:hypothetical protein